MLQSIIKLSRDSQYVNKMRLYKIYVNQEYIRDIEDGETIEIQVPSGMVEIMISIDRIYSRPLRVVVKDNQTIKLECGCSWKGKTMVKKMMNPFASFTMYSDKYFLYIKEVK